MYPHQARPAWRVLLFVLCLVTTGFLTTLPTPIAAKDLSDDEAHDIRKLAGPWQATLIWSGSGCGPMSGLVNFILDSAGTTNSAVLVTHAGFAPGCGDRTLTGQTFTIQSLNPDGSGTAGLTCGTGCGWVFRIQVARDDEIFNMVDVEPTNPGNFVEGSAIRQSKGHK